MLEVRKSHNGKDIQSHNQNSFYTVCEVCNESEKEVGKLEPLNRNKSRTQIMMEISRLPTVSQQTN